jgi:fucose permease
MLRLAQPSMIGCDTARNACLKTGVLCDPALMHVDAAARHAMRRNALTLGLASLGFVSLGLPEGLLGVAWPSIRATFGLPLDALGLLLATFATGYFVSSAASGGVLARFGVGSTLAASCALTGTCLFGYALSPAWVSMVALGGVLGLGAGTIDASLNTYAAVQHGPRVLNWMHAAFGIGAAVGPLLMTAVLALGLSWSIGYIAVGAAQLVLAGGYAALRRQLQVNTPGQGPAQRSQLQELLRMPIVWVILALFFAYVGVEVVAGQWSYSLFTQSRGMPAALAGVIVSAYWASLTGGRLLFGLLVNRIGVDSLLRGCSLAIIGAAIVLWANLPVVSPLALAIIGLAAAPIFPCLIADTPRRLGDSHTANAVGLQVAAAVLGGAVIPGASGALAARVGLEIIPACIAAAGVCVFALHEYLVRTACAPRRSGRCRSDAAASSLPGA